MIPLFVNVSPLRLSVIVLLVASVNPKFTVVPKVLVVETAPPLRFSVPDVAGEVNWNAKEPLPADDWMPIAPPFDVVTVAVAATAVLALTVRTGAVIDSAVAAVPPIPLSTVRAVPLLKVIPVEVSAALSWVSPGVVFSWRKTPVPASVKAPEVF